MSPPASVRFCSLNRWWCSAGLARWENDLHFVFFLRSKLTLVPHVEALKCKRMSTCFQECLWSVVNKVHIGRLAHPRAPQLPRVLYMNTCEYNAGIVPKCAFGCFLKIRLPRFHRCSRRWAPLRRRCAFTALHDIQASAARNRCSSVSAPAVVVSVWQQNKLLKLVLHWKVILIWSCFTLSTGERARGGGGETAVNRWARQRCELAPLKLPTMPCSTQRGWHCLGCARARASQRQKQSAAPVWMVNYTEINEKQGADCLRT